ncbi:ABC transporter ATP-binding protein/permease [uncultured Clostridium sp.]|uniref:ABC transporter ATP-binding protein/permease n=1 Tax=uncultured Clostridium sp. TaxID=59620 RepID=UPI00262A5C5D|nr:ABC transporter ATP-binding protein/permease [uncultured Clostridium sp.]
MFEIKRVSKKYGNEYALKNLNFDIGRGLNFIIGASGSGKSTLLKIITGQENDFEGEVLFFEESIKNLTESQKAYYYNNKIGFVWQDFNLLEDMTVEENLLLPLHIKNVNNKKEVEKQLKKLNILDLRYAKVRNLSGGQKQRVAIARELMKNPQVLIADEPTSALDRENALEVIKILKDVAKERTVIIVTHDTSLIEKDAKVYKLDKGELIEKPEKIIGKIQEKEVSVWRPFKLSSAFNVGKINIKSKKGKTLISSMAIIISTILVITSLGGAIAKKGNETFDELYNSYGKAVLDLMVVKSFTGASGMEGDEEEAPNVDVKQDIDGVYDKYINDSRVDYILFDKPVDKIKIQADGKEYSIPRSGNAPTINEVLEGNIPKNKNEVLVPESFVKKMGISNKEAIGKEIDFKAIIYSWKNENEPEEEPIEVKLKIVGVGDTKLKVTYEGMTNEFELEDSFFFDKETIDEMNKQAGIEVEDNNFVIRAKNFKDLIEIKNELNAEGILPIGYFELIEDLVSLELQTKSLSEGSMRIIGMLALVGLVAISLIMGIIRKREYAIYKICGYSNKQLNIVLIAENIMIGGIAVLSTIVISPIIYKLTKGTFGTSLGIKEILMIVIIGSVMVVISYVIEALIAKKTIPLKILKSGER